MFLTHQPRWQTVASGWAASHQLTARVGHSWGSCRHFDCMMMERPWQEGRVFSKHLGLDLRTRITSSGTSTGTETRRPGLHNKQLGGEDRERRWLAGPGSSPVWRRWSIPFTPQAADGPRRDQQGSKKEVWGLLTLSVLGEVKVDLANFGVKFPTKFFLYRIYKKYLFMQKCRWGRRRHLHHQ